jgi:hypothetical protein
LRTENEGGVKTALLHAVNKVVVLNIKFIRSGVRSDLLLFSLQQRIDLDTFDDLWKYSHID